MLRRPMTDHPHLRVLDALTEASEAADEAAFCRLFAADATIWQNLGRRATSVPDFLTVLRMLAQTVAERRYVDRRIDLFEGGAVEQHVLEGVRTRDQKRVRLRACVVVRFDADGLIVELREYLDSREATEFSRPH